MSFAFEVYYSLPEDLKRQQACVEMVESFGGKLDFRELTGPSSETVCLTFRFEEKESADRAAKQLQLQKEHVEGPYEY